MVTSKQSLQALNQCQLTKQKLHLNLSRASSKNSHFPFDPMIGRRKYGNNIAEYWHFASGHRISYRAVSREIPYPTLHRQERRKARRGEGSCHE